MGVIQLQQGRIAQPQYAAPIDYQGLGKGVKILFNPPAGYVDLATGRQWARNGNAQITPSAHGKSLSFDGNNSSLNITGYPELEGIGTFFAFFDRVGASDPFGHDYLGSISPNNKHYLVSSAGRIWAGTPYNSNEAISGWFGTNNRSLVCAEATGPADVKAYVDGRDSGLTWSSSGSVAWGSGNKNIEVGGAADSTNWDANCDVVIIGWTSEIWGAEEALAFHNSRGLALFSLSRKLWISASVPSSDGAGSASGSSTVSGIGASAAESTGSSSGTSAALAVGSSGSVSESVGTATGASTASATGESLAESVGSSSGVASASGTGIAEIPASGTAAGTSTVSAVGVSATGSSGTATGTSTADASGSSVAASGGTANGVAAASGIGSSVASVSGSASGLATVAGVGDSIIPGSATGTASGTSSASGIGASVAESTGTASGDGTATGKGSSSGGVVESFSGGYLYISKEEREEIKRKQRIKLGIIEELQDNKEPINSNLSSESAIFSRKTADRKKKLIPARQQKKIDQDALNTELKALLKKQIQIEEELEEETILRMLMEI